MSKERGDGRSARGLDEDRRTEDKPQVRLTADAEPACSKQAERLLPTVPAGSLVMYTTPLLRSFFVISRKQVVVSIKIFFTPITAVNTQFVIALQTIL